MNCLRKIHEDAEKIADATTAEERSELEELTVLLEGRYVAEDYLS